MITLKSRKDKGGQFLSIVTEYDPDSSTNPAALVHLSAPQHLGMKANQVRNKEHRHHHMWHFRTETKHREQLK